MTDSGLFCRSLGRLPDQPDNRFHSFHGKLCRPSCLFLAFFHLLGRPFRLVLHRPEPFPFSSDSFSHAFLSEIQGMHPSRHGFSRGIPGPAHELHLSFQPLRVFGRERPFLLRTISVRCLERSFCFSIFENRRFSVLEGFFLSSLYPAFFSPILYIL